MDAFDKKIVIGYDHRGAIIKQIVIDKLRSIIGHSPFSPAIMDLNGTEKKIDYPIPAEVVAQYVAKKEFDFGILICGTGIGMSIAANKVPGIRAAHINNTHDAEATRKHNDANILCLGSDCFDSDRDTPVIESILHIFFTTEFEGGRHKNRIDKIKTIEQKHSIQHAAKILNKYMC